MIVLLACAAPRPAPPFAEVPAIRAPTLTELCASYAQAHLAREGTTTAHGCHDERIDGERGEVTLTVRYAHWGYSLVLDARREGERRALANVRRGSTFHR
ncbi:MAG: hypothetical protein ACOZNI_05315 [Myxococcota bacterium]